MQSIFRLPWCSDPIAPKADHAPALDKMRPTPMVEIPVLNKLKRKRANSSEFNLASQQEYKKLRPDTHDSQLHTPSSLSPQPAQPQALAHTEATASTLPTAPTETAGGEPLKSVKADSGLDLPSSAKTMDICTDTLPIDTMLPASADAKGYSPLQQVIENEFNMQILMKHNELRLIEQELAKCQVALEQLRRCELRPYPGSVAPSEAVSAGTGAAVLPPPGYSRPSHPAPYGVLDGPYSRHYRQWVLQDPQFDAVPLHLLQSDLSGRPTRNSAPVRRSVGQPFTFPGRPAEKLPSIPNYPAALAKERNQPNVLRRSTDGQLVKLICNNCQRGNFSSIQGFLNHCRIAHKVDYKSHDAAAIDCGRPLDEAEAASLPPEAQNTPAPKPTVARTPTAAPTTQRSTSNLVHPLNSSGSPLNLGRSKPNPSRKAARSLDPAKFPASNAPLKPSAQLPRLSAHFAKFNQGGDLAKAIADAKQKIDLGVDDDLSSPDTSAQNSPLATPFGGRGPASLGVNSSSGPRPPSQKGFRQPTQQSKSRPSPLAPVQIKQEQGEMHNVPGSPHSHASSSAARTPSFDLSPHTADSNPGLVSDHEEDEDDHGSSSENEEVPSSLRPPHPSRAGQGLPGTHQATCGAENMEIDVAIEDDEIERDGVIIRRNSISDGAGGRKFGGPTKGGR